MIHTNVSGSPRNCALYFLSQLSAAPIFLIYCSKNTVEVPDKARYCIYEDNPIVVEIDRSRLRGGPVDAPVAAKRNRHKDGNGAKYGGNEVYPSAPP